MAPLNYRSAEDCMFFYNCRKGFLQTEISVNCHPALDWHLKSLCIASDKTTRNCNYLHWSEIWPSCPLQFGGKSLISFMGRETAGARQGYWPRPAGEELRAAKKNISNVSAHESSRSCAVRAIPVKKISSRFPRVEEEEALRQTGMRSRGGALCPSHLHLRWRKKRRWLNCPASRWKAPKVNIRHGERWKKQRAGWWGWNRREHRCRAWRRVTGWYGGPGHSLAKVIKSLRPVIFPPGRKKD